MSRQLCLIVCSHFEREVQALSDHPDFQGVRLIANPVGCDQFEAKWPGLEKTIGTCRDQGHSFCLVGSFCLNRALTDLGPQKTCPSVQKGSCFEWIADRDVLDRYLQEGAHLLIPGWLKNWKIHVTEKWGSDRKAAQSFFRGMARKLLLLDTGLYPKIDQDLEDFAKLVRLPVEIHPAGLGHFRLNLGQLVLNWKLAAVRHETEDKVETIRRENSGYARIGRLLSSLGKAATDEDVLGGISEILSGLLSPGEVVFHDAAALDGLKRSEDSPVDRILCLNADYAWTGDKSGLFLKVAVGRQLFGILEVSGLAAADNREQACNAGLTAAGVAGLALANVRSFRALREEREKAQSAEAALKISEERVRSVFESVPVGIYRTTASGQIIDANPTLANMLGYPDVAALKAVNTKDLHLNPGDRDTWKSLLDGNGFIENFETQLRRLDGTVIWVKDTARSVKDGQGKTLFFDGTLEDITKRKQSESALSWNWRMRDAIAKLSSRLLSPTTIEEMSALVLEHARRLTASRTGFVGYVDRQTGKLVPGGMTPDAREMIDKHPEKAADAHESSSLWGWVLKGKKPILANVPSLDPRYSGMPEWHLPVGQFLCVPAVMSGNLVGLITLSNSERMFSEQDLEVVERLATLYAIAVHRTRTEAELRELSLVDDLTRLYNRRGFLTLAEQQLKIANRTKKEMYLLYADLDDLKQINDTLGHQEGDQALVETATVLKDAFRDSDIIARIGGDEFVVLALDTQEGNAEVLLRRVKDKLEARNGRNGRKYVLSLSLGIAAYLPEDPCSIQDLVAAADRLMYEEKTAKKPHPLPA